MDRADLVSVLNSSNLSKSLISLHQAVVAQAMSSMVSTQPEEEPNRRNQDRCLLNQVGPAAAATAIEYATTKCRKYFPSLHLNGSFVQNFKLMQNSTDCGDGYNNFSNVMRQFLLPRYAYLDFDSITDPRHRIDEECGYPKFITPIMYRYLYDRDDTARRVVDLFPEETWAADPLVYETEDEDNWSPFEKFWQYLCEEKQLLQYLYRIDRLAGIGHYGVLLMGIDDGLPLDMPIAGIDPWGNKDPNYKGRTNKLLYLRPFDEYLSFIHQYETNTNHPRYGLPNYYNLVFLDMTIDAAGASIGTRLNRRVHWTRVVHVADNLQSSLVFGTPRMQPVFNRLLDLRKIKGGSAEMFWKGAFPGLSFEIDPRFASDELDYDKEKFREEIERYSSGLERVLTTVGIKVNSLAPQVVAPDKHVTTQMQAIASNMGCPLRVFLGSEAGRLASSQDSLTWNKRLGRKLRMYTEPHVIRNTLNRFVAASIMPAPSSGRYKVDWGDLNTATDEDKANLSLKWTQALSQYVASGVIHLIPPMDYLTMILGLKPSDAKRILDEVEKKGGLAKLAKVDPSQGAGVNGKRENIASKSDSGDISKGRKKKRNSADKKAEGIKS